MDQQYSPEYDPNSVDRERFERQGPRAHAPKWLMGLVTAGVVAVIAAAFFYSFEERQRNRELASANQRLAANLTQFQRRIETMNERLSTLQSPTQATPATHPAHPRQTRARAAGRVSEVRPDPRLEKIQRQLAEQQLLISSARGDINQTRSDLTQTREDLQNNISSAKDELNGSIARTHDEVVALQKRGERNYYEFSADKSKQFSRVGPVSIELRKADTKHKRFDMTMLVDDNQLQKKGVNLYEIVWISLSDRPQPMELVVNKISKNHVEGYLSEPKYKSSELQSTASVNSPGGAGKPVSTQPLHQ